MAIERIQFRRDTSANWASANPILANGEPAVDTDLDQWKIGDGVTRWNALAWQEGSGEGGGGAVASVAGRTGTVTLTVDDLTDAQTAGKAVVRAETTAAARLAVGLPNVDNTSDNLKPISNATQAALDDKASVTELNNVAGQASTAQSDIDDFKGTKGQPNGLASLDAGSKIPASQLPSYVDDVLEFDDFADLPATGEVGKIYVTIDNGYEYRWGGSTYIRLVASPGSTDALPEGTLNLYFSDARAQAALTSQLAAKAPVNNPTFTGTVSGVTKAHVGLGNVNNTSDADKPISTATQTALNDKAPTHNPTFTGSVGGIEKGDILGLDNVDNTSDEDKPVSTATRTELDKNIIVRWNGTSWPARPASAPFGVTFLSTNDPEATAPDDVNLATGDIWKRHADAS